MSEEAEASAIARSMPACSTGSSGVAQTGGVGHTKQNLSDLDILLDEIAGRARNIGHDRPLAAEQRSAVWTCRRSAFRG